MLRQANTRHNIMNYMIRKPKSETFLGPYSLAEISSQLQAQTITEDYEAIASSGQSFTVLRHSDDWVRVSRLLSPGTTESGAGQPASPITSVERRYRDAYLVASAVAAIGAAVKIAGIILGLLIIMGGFLTGLQSGSIVLGLFGVLIGAVAAIIIFVLGVFVSAQAQILKATLDSAVHSSPFLTKDDMAKVMSL